MNPFSAPSVGTGLDIPAPAQAPARKNLSRRTLLGTAGGLLTQGATLFTNLVLTPVTAGLLGQSLFGVWTMINQINNYIALGEFRVASVLKYQLAGLQHSDDFSHKRRLVGASVLLLAVILPLLVLAIFATAWMSPAIFPGVHEHLPAIRWAMGISGAGMLLMQVVSVPGGVMRGENLDYKAMWLRSSLVVFTSVVGLGLLFYGWGLIGLAVAVLLRQIIYTIVWQVLACRHVSWYGVERPSRAEVTSAARGSVWVFCSGLGFLALSTGDLILAGIMLGPAAASTYYVTGALLRFAMMPMGSLNAASGPGIAGLCGAGDWTRLGKVMNDYSLITQFYLAWIGAVALAVNASFILSWMGPAYDGGHLLLALLLVGRVLLTQLEIDGNVLDGMLCFRQRAMVLAGGVALALVISVWAGRQWGLAGMAAGPLTGRVLTLVLFRRLIANAQPGLRLSGMFRPRLLVVTVALWALAWTSIQSYQPVGWTTLAAISAITAGISFVILCFVGLGTADRGLIQARFGNLLHRFASRLPGRSS